MTDLEYLQLQQIDLNKYDIKQFIWWDTIGPIEDRFIGSVRLFGKNALVGYLNKSNLAVSERLSQNYFLITRIFVETKEPENLYDVILNVNWWDHTQISLSGQSCKDQKIQVLISDQHPFNIEWFGMLPKNFCRVHLEGYELRKSF